jgi:transposase
MSPEYVRPYVKSQKNDDRDAEAIAEAATRPTMRFIEVEGLGAARHADITSSSRSTCGGTNRVDQSAASGAAGTRHHLRKAGVNSNDISRAGTRR